jgi:hypothetical protein
LAVSIAHDVSVTTWNNDLSDFRDHTLIDPESSLFNVVSKMHVGQRIFFSGSFAAAEGKECIEEKSLTLHGKLEQPEFTFKFTSASPEPPSDSDISELPRSVTRVQSEAEDELSSAAGESPQDRATQ